MIDRAIERRVQYPVPSWATNPQATPTVKPMSDALAAALTHGSEHHRLFAPPPLPMEVRQAKTEDAVGRLLALLNAKGIISDEEALSVVGMGHTDVTVLPPDPERW